LWQYSCYYFWFDGEYFQICTTYRLKRATFNACYLNRPLRSQNYYARTFGFTYVRFCWIQIDNDGVMTGRIPNAAAHCKTCGVHRRIVFIVTRVIIRVWRRNSVRCCTAPYRGVGRKTLIIVYTIFSNINLYIYIYICIVV